jgi:hypothetical protein
MDEVDENFDDYMGNNDILDYLPKSSELEGEDPDLFKLSVEEGHEDEEFDRIPELPKFLANKVNPHLINLDSTMTTDQTNDENEQEFDEDELYIIDSLEKKQRREDRENQVFKPEQRQRNDGDDRNRSKTEEEEADEDEDEENQRNDISPPYHCLSPDTGDTGFSATVNNKSNIYDSFSAASVNKSQPLYQHELNKPRFTAGKKQLSIAEAKLFGLLNEKGELVDLKPTSQSGKNDFAAKKYLYEMATPKAASSSNDDNGYGKEADKEDCTFAPKRSDEALKAMKNPRCGYDFMERINNRGSFLDRVNNLSSSSSGRKGGTIDGGKPLSKTEYETMKQDYDSLLTKLQCPTCLKCQTFDEFLNKKRICTLCHVKFEKLNISSGLSFTKKNKEYEKKRLEKLAEIDKEMYGNIPRKDNHLLAASVSPPPLPPTVAAAVPSSSFRSHQLQSRRHILLKTKENLENSKNNENDSVEEKEEDFTKKNQKTIPIPSSSSSIDQKQALQKILSISQNNAKTLNQTLQHLFPSAENTKHSTTVGRSNVAPANGDKGEKKKYNVDSFPPISSAGHLPPHSSSLSSSEHHELQQSESKSGNKSRKVGNNIRINSIINNSNSRNSMTEKLERLMHV